MSGPSSWRPGSSGPERIKLVPIILALRDDDGHHPIVVSTSQHHRMVAEIFELAGIKTDAAALVRCRVHPPPCWRQPATRGRSIRVRRAARRARPAGAAARRDHVA